MVKLYTASHLIGASRQRCVGEKGTQNLKQDGHGRFSPRLGTKWLAKFFLALHRAFVRIRASKIPQDLKSALVSPRSDSTAQSFFA